MDWIAQRSSTFFSKNLNKEDTCLIVDEVGFQKKGTASACVGRQWLGCLGKQDNGQVAVALSLSNNHLSSIINLELFIPKAWASDPDRCSKAGVPYRNHQTKPEIALDMIKKAVSDKIKFSWIAFDALYGSSLPFTRGLDAQGLTFIGDIRGDITIYYEKPVVSVPANKSNQGRRYRFAKPETDPIPIETYVKNLAEKAWEKISFRKGKKGKLEFYYHKKQIWIWDDKNRELVSYVLLAKKSLDGKELKYSLSNVQPTVSIERLAYMQGQRFFIEQCFKEGKNQTGMGDYQVRSWKGFHRHMALSMLALNFLMEQKYKHNQGELEGITIPKLVEIFKLFLPLKHTTADTLIQEIQEFLRQYRNQQQKYK